MTLPLAETLTRLRVGNQTFLTNFYQQHRDDFARWARLRHQVSAADAHDILRTVLLDFYDQVADGRLTKLPPDLRNHFYDQAALLLPAPGKEPAAGLLPVREADRRQRLLGLFGQLSTDCQKVLMYFYFRGYNFEKVAGKMGFANATVARLQKSSCLRRLYELSSQPTGDAAGGSPGL